MCVFLKLVASTLDHTAVHHEDAAMMVSVKLWLYFSGELMYTWQRSGPDLKEKGQISKINSSSH